MGLLFFPRGGSAYVARYLSAALAKAGADVSLVCGSLGPPGEETNAATFFAGIDVHALDYTDAVAVFRAGGSAITAPIPMHPSFEDRPDAPDVVLGRRSPRARGPPRVGVGGAVVRRQDRRRRRGAPASSDAAARHGHAPLADTPVLAHLHGTELKLIEAIEERVALAAALGSTLADMPEQSRRSCGPRRRAARAAPTRRDGISGDTASSGPRICAQAQQADHVVVVSPPDRATAIELLGLEPERVTAIPNGVDIEHFCPRTLSPAQRRASFRHWLVEDPQGWRDGGGPGSVAYVDDDLDRLLGPAGDATVLLYVGRFTSAKRVPVLIRAFAQARTRFERPASLVVWGGSPGEFEDEHPVTVAAEVGADGIFFAGWRGHEDLPEALAASDALVMSSVNDSYPQAPLEAMAVGLPVIATRSGGFPSMINLDPAQPTGWLVEADDVGALAQGLVDVVNHPDELARRGENALAHARADLSWDGLVGRFQDAYAAAVARHAAVGRS